MHLKSNPIPVLTSEEQRRFWSRVTKLPGDDACWEWDKPGSRGYGKVSFRKTTYPPHRIAYALLKRMPKVDEMVLHRCDNRLCVNHNHLFLGNHQDNVADMMQKRRHAAYRDPEKFRRDRPGMFLFHLVREYERGEDHAQAKLSEDEIRTIRSLYSGGGWSYRRLADRFGIGKTTVENIVKGRKWAHLPT